VHCVRVGGSHFILFIFLLLSGVVYGRENQSILSGKKRGKRMRILATEDDFG
jgi:hypothetical protein